MSISVKQYAPFPPHGRPLFTQESLNKNNHAQNIGGEKSSGTSGGGHKIEVDMLCRYPNAA